MLSELMNQASNHLEFLGYKISPLDKENEALRATRPGRYPFSLYANEHVLSLCAYFSTKTEDELGLLQFINSLNLNSSVISFCKNASNTIVCQAVYHGAYTKMDFGLFYETWDQDLDTPLRERRAEFKKYLG